MRSPRNWIFLSPGQIVFSPSQETFLLRNFFNGKVLLEIVVMVLFFNWFLACRDPNEHMKQEGILTGSKERNRFRNIVWEEYDAVHQKYLEIGRDISYDPKIKCVNFGMALYWKIGNEMILFLLYCLLHLYKHLPEIYASELTNNIIAYIWLKCFNFFLNSFYCFCWMLESNNNKYNLLRWLGNMSCKLKHDWYNLTLVSGKSYRLKYLKF